MAKNKELNKIQSRLSKYDPMDIVTKKSLDKKKDELIKKTQKNAESGSGTNSSGNKQSYEELSPYTITKREEMRKAGKLSSKTKPGKSNQIATGELIGDITGKTRKGKTKSTIEMSPSKNRIDVAIKQEKMGNETFYFRDDDIDDFVDELEDELLKQLEDLFSV